jgi:hypothetical protein
MSKLRRDAPARPVPRLLVLLNPAGAFASVALRPLWGLAVVVVLACAVLPPLAFVARADIAAVVEKELKRAGRLEKIPEDERARVLELGATAMKVALPAGAVAKRALWMTLLSLVIFGLSKTARPELKLSPVAGAVGLAMAPLAVQDLLVAATFLSVTPSALAALDATNPILSNPAAVFGLDAGHSIAGALLKGLDFFELWSAALVGFGVNRVLATRSSTPWAVAFGGHAAAVVASVGSAAAGS